MQRANESLAEFQRIRHWVVWPKSDFPRTTGTRKVIKGQVAEAVKAMLLTNAGDCEWTVRASAFESSRDQPDRWPAQPTLDLSANLADDLKLDSLGRVELLSALEDQYQIELDEAAITEATTIADIEQIVSRGKSEAVAYPYPRWAMRFPMTWMRPRLSHLSCMPLTLIMCRVRVVGAERLAKVKGPASVHFKSRDSRLMQD